MNTVSAKRVLDERAYMLFYIRDKVRPKEDKPEVPISETLPQKRKLEESNESAPKKQKIQENGKPNGNHNGVSKANGTPRPKILDADEEKGAKVGKSEIDQLFQK